MATTPLGFYFPGIGDPPNGPDAIRQASTSIDTFLTNALPIVGGAQPTAPVAGRTVWLNTASGHVEFWDGTNWNVMPRNWYLTVAPTTPAVGDIWYNPSNRQTGSWDGTQWHFLPAGIIAIAVGPATTINVATSGTMVSVTANCIAGHYYEITGYIQVSQLSGTGNQVVRLGGSSSADILINQPGVTAGASEIGSATGFFLCPTSGSYTFTINGGTTSGAMQIGTNAGRLTVKDIGG